MQIGSPLPIETLIANPSEDQPSDPETELTQVDMLYCPGGQTTTHSYPVLQGREVLTTQLMINPQPIDRKAVAHTITVNGTDVTVTGGSEDTYVLVLMR